MGDKKGDQQSRAELLGKLLLAVDVQPYMLRHGSERDIYYLVLLRLNDADHKALETTVGAPVNRIKVGGIQMVPLPLETNAVIGVVDAKYYNAEKQQWTGSITVSRFR